jgi:hypothetical protein
MKRQSRDNNNKVKIICNSKIIYFRSFYKKCDNLMETTRKFNSEITIDSQRRWFYRGQEIVQKKVLDFFKEQLFEDEQGVFILNQHKNFTEYGYVEVFSPPLSILEYEPTAETIYFLSDGRDNPIRLENLGFFWDENDTVYCQLATANFLTYFVHRKVLAYLSNFFVEENDGVSLVYHSIRKQILYKKKMPVKVPFSIALLPVAE